MGSQHWLVYLQTAASHIFKHSFMQMLKATEVKYQVCLVSSWEITSNTSINLVLNTFGVNVQLLYIVTTYS